ncbi:MAG: hypothetical protein HY820_27300 [Acidobacteria bacterium]|nr:hypothetical protein [Acidobacteriota bacterium]
MIIIRSVSLIVCAAVFAAAQQSSNAPAARPPRPPQPGVPGVQQRMSMIVPDGQYDIGGGPDWMAAGDDMMWTNAKGQDFVARMNPRTNEVVARVKMTKPCSGLVVAAGSLWAPSCEENVIYRIDTATNTTVAKIPVGPANTEGGITFGAGSIWMPTNPKGIEVARIDPATNQVIARVPVPPGSYTAIFGFGLIWVSSTETSVVSVIHPDTNKVIASIPVDKNPRFMSAGEGHIWTLNQAAGTVTKIDPYSKTAIATIAVGVPGTGGDIAAGEGSVWVTAHSIPVSRIDPNTNSVVQQFPGPGGDAIRVAHGSVWLANGRWRHTWRFQPAKLTRTVPSSWTVNAQHADLDGDGKADVLVEDLITWFPGEPTRFRIRPLNAALGGYTLKTTLNGKAATSSFTKSGDEWVATFQGNEPRWIHYSVCAGNGKCSPELVVASPTTALSYATKKMRFVPDDFLLPVVPALKGYVWNILEPTILDQDYQALVDRYQRTGPMNGTKAEDYGELKRHEWEFQNQTAFAWGILTPDKSLEVACVYVNPSKKQGYDAQVRIWVTKQGAEAGLEPVLEAAVREWIATKWPFKKVAYPGRDMPMEKWNSLSDATLE